MFREPVRRGRRWFTEPPRANAGREFCFRVTSSIVRFTSFSLGVLKKKGSSKMLRLLQFGKQGLRRSVLQFGVAVLVLFASSSLATAATVYMTGSGNWTTASIWTGGTGVPTASDDAWVHLGYTNTVSTAMSAVCKSLTVGGYGPGGGGTGLLSVTGGSLMVGSSIALSQYGPNGNNGSVTQSDGVITATTEYVGQNSGAIFTQTGGTNNVTSLYLGSTGTIQSNAVTYSLNGGVLSRKHHQEHLRYEHVQARRRNASGKRSFTTAMPMALTASTTSIIDPQTFSLGLSGVLSGLGGAD